MNDQPNPEFDAVHPSGMILFRSCRGGFMHSVALSEDVMNTDSASLAEAILRTAQVSFVKAALEVRAELIAGNPDEGPSAAVPTPQDLDEALVALNAHTLPMNQH
ncbi:DUF2694 family protein [Mycolicibacterium novocastrense]|uniref:DUF2694 family protein n=1 Tax=Mycolicibacterium novocastrense TaxID=59813 RepID=A0AAW5SHW8_MYCNV|nr:MULTISPECIES: DUF2694 family protein [Mycolicibacterium]MCV7023648.1 DUF2694 family protein [Mycolicibacterium novocastrense]MDX1886883.1 DUF2694 family protein [Mycolicibacterium sp. 120270]GAT07708.1 hypothetical protein RMCN_0841 [Mycolicibacterium novocastrense]